MKKRRRRNQVRYIRKHGEVVGLQLRFSEALPILLVQTDDGEIESLMVESSFFTALEDRLRSMILAAAQNGV